MAAMMIGDVLRADGFDVHHLGTDVPPTDLALFLGIVPADVVCFSVTAPMAAGSYRELVAACHEHAPDTLVVFGGQGADLAMARAAGAHAVEGVTGLTAILAGH